MDSCEPQWFDDRTRQPPDPRKVREGRAKDHEKLMHREVCGPVLRTKAREFFRTKWVETQKGEDVRCRFVAQEVAAGDPGSGLFASTPPLFLAKIVVSMAAWQRASNSGKENWRPL